MRQLSLRSERDRLLIAIAAALIIHVAIFVLVPFSGPADRDPLDPPLYVALDPLPSDPEEEPPEPPQEEQSEPEPQPEPQPERAPEPEPEPEPEPDTEALMADESPAQDDPVTAEAEDPAPAPEPDAAPTPVPEPEPAPTPELETAPAPDQPAEPPQPAEATQPAEAEPEEDPDPAGPAFVETPPPPPPPPRQRQFSNVRSEFGGDSPERESGFVDQQISSLYDWQSQYSDQLEAWQERQQARSARTSPAESRDDRSADSDSALSRQLAALIDGIRTSSSNVVDSTDSSRSSRADRDQNSGDGSGITVEDSSGTRRRTEGAPVDLASVSLGAGFPPEYPVQVRFQVNAAGTVVSAAVQPPTPDPDLNRAIETAVRQWRFEAAGDRQAQPVQGSVTIIVQTR